MQNSKSRFISIYSTPMMSEMVIIKSLLDANGIPYFVTNENLNTLYGPANGFTTMDVTVPENKFKEAKELLKEFIRPKNKKKD